MHLTVGTWDQDNVISFFWGYDSANAASIDIVSGTFERLAGSVEQEGGVSEIDLRDLNATLRKLERFWSEHILYRL